MGRVPVWMAPGGQIAAADLDACCAALQAGGIVAIPTETVYGLAAAAWDDDALARLYELKGRPEDRTCPLQVAAPAAVLPLLAGPPPSAAFVLLERFSPGPLTVVLEARPDLPRWVLGPGCTIGVRIPDHPAALAVLRRFAAPLAVTSANRSGEPPATDAQGVLGALASGLAGVVDAGATGSGVPSTVVAVSGSTARILRRGAIDAAALRAALAGSACLVEEP